MFQDPRFNSEIDLRTGYKTNSILCMPICNYEGDVIGVAQIINKTDHSQEFTPHDVEVFQRYLTFCGIGIQNAQLFEVSVMEYRRNQVRLFIHTPWGNPRKFFYKTKIIWTFLDVFQLPTRTIAEKNLRLSFCKIFLDKFSPLAQLLDNIHLQYV